VHPRQGPRRKSPRRREKDASLVSEKNKGAFSIQRGRGGGRRAVSSRRNTFFFHKEEAIADGREGMSARSQIAFLLLRARRDFGDGRKKLHSMRTRSKKRPRERLLPSVRNKEGASEVLPKMLNGGLHLRLGSRERNLFAAGRGGKAAGGEKADLTRTGGRKRLLVGSARKRRKAYGET